MSRKLLIVLITLVSLIGFLSYDHYFGNLVQMDDVLRPVPKEELKWTGDRFQSAVTSYLQDMSEGDLGTLSVRNKRQVTSGDMLKMVQDMVVRSAKILVPALLVGVSCGVLFGSLIYFVPEKVRKGIMAGNQLLFSIPDLLLIIFLQMGAIWIDQLTGRVLIGVVEVSNRPIHLLPIMTVAIPIAAYMFGYTVNACREVMQQEFIRTSRAKGLPGWYVFVKHVMRPAADSILVAVPKMAAVGAAGLVVVERLYNIMGITWFFNGAVMNNPAVPRLLATLLICLAVYSIGVKLITSMLRLWVNPSLRKGGGAL